MRWRAFVGLSLLHIACDTGILENPVPVCDELLQCAAPVEESCTGAETPVTLPETGICPEAQYSDTQRDAYPLGDTVVQFDATVTSVGFLRSATCDTVVTIIDETPPVLTCEDRVTLTRTNPSEPYPEPPVATAVDTCDPDLELTLNPETLSAPVTNVTTTATDSSGNKSTCETRVTVVDIFPMLDVRLLGAELGGTSSTRFTLGWELPNLDVEQVQLQQATSASGPWEVVSTGTASLQTITAEQTEAHWYRLQSFAEDIAGGVSDSVFIHAISADEYDIRNVSVPDVSFDTTLYGVVRHPSDLSAGPYPLVLLMHGNHGNCRRNGTTDDYCATTRDHDCDSGGYSTTPNAEGLAYLAETFAARGMVAVTVSANAMNCRSGYILERANLLWSHLDVWADWQAGVSGAMGTKFASVMDLSRVGLVGHSRGGDAVAHMPQIMEDRPISGVDVSSIFAIAPTDYNDATVFDAAWALLLPACDGDVSSLWGVDIHERSKDNVWEKSQVFFAGANHNYFSTEWYFDDGYYACNGGARVGWEAQLTMLQASLGSWMTHTLETEAPPEAFQRAEVAPPSSISAWAGRELDTRWSYTHDGALLIDAFTGGGDTNELGGSNTYTEFSWNSPCAAGSCGDRFVSPTSAIRLNWDDDDTAEAAFSLGGISTDAYDAFSLRIGSRYSSANNTRTEHFLTITLEDADGDTASFEITEEIPVPHMYSGYNPREILQSLRIPFSAITAKNAAVNTDQLTRVRIVFNGDGDAGSVALTDLELGY